MASSREYETTHPWLSFRLDLKKFNNSPSAYQFWIELGAVVSKTRHISNSLLPPKVADEFYKLWLVKGAQATTAIEGNTLSEEQVREVLEERSSVPASQEYQEQEVKNIITACEEIYDELLEGEADIELTVSRIKKFNRQVLENLELETYVTPGEVSKVNIVVGNFYRGAPRQDCEYLMQKMCDTFGGLVPGTDKYQMHFAIINAIVLHVYFVKIHPFGDGNGRTARLIELFVLGRAGVPLACAHLLSNHYNQTRSEYNRYLKLASAKENGIFDFLCYAVSGLRDGLVEQIRVIDIHQWSATWKEHVFETFDSSGRRKNAAYVRQRQIALDLWRTSVSGVQPSMIPDISSDVRIQFAKLKKPTWRQDVATLREMGLVEILSDGKVRASFGKVMAEQSMPQRILEDAE